MNPTEDDEGRRIGKYRNAVLLDHGGMGDIYRAAHPTLDRPVVLKMLTLTGSDQFIQRFQREATIMMGFQHENIVNYYDHFKTARSYCMVMELVDGCSLAQLLTRQRALSSEIAILLLRDILRALNYSHSKGVIHRDIKPANILISSAGEVKLTDFGIAHDTDLDDEGPTRAGMTLGTPSYMAPEQFMDAGAVDGRADLYSAGVLLYEALTGRKPFSASTLTELMEQIRRGRYERLRTLRPDACAAARRFVRRNLNSRPGRRYRNASAALGALERYLSRRSEESLRRNLADLVTDRRRVTGGGDELSVRRIVRGVLLGMGSLVLAALVCGAWFMLALTARLPPALLPGFFGGIRLEIPLPEWEMPRPRVQLEVYRFDSVGYQSSGFRLSDADGRLPISDRLPWPTEWNSERNRTGNSGEDAQLSSPEKLIAGPILLRPGLYQVKIRIGDTITTRAVQVQSMKDLRRSSTEKSSVTSLIVLTQPWEPVVTPVEVSWRLRSAVSGMEITGYPVPLVADDAGRPYRVSGGSVLLNIGRRYDFTFRARGYQSATVGAWLDPGIERYTLSVDMLPEPAILRLSSSLPLCRPILDGRTIYRDGGAEGRFRRIGVVTDKGRELILPPGTYLLTCGRTNEAAVTLELAPGSVTNRRLVRDAERRPAWIEVDDD